MKISSQQLHARRIGPRGFTLVETVISIGILGLVVEGVILGYVKISQQVEWSSRSLAAQAIASQGAEQARSAKWDTQSPNPAVGPGQSDELGVTNYIQTSTLDVPNTGQPDVVTNYIAITRVSSDPPIRQIRSDCVWSFMNRGWYTNTVVTLRTSDQ